VSVVSAVSTESYVAVVAAITHTVVATATDTRRSIAQKLAALIDAGASGAKTYNLRTSGGSSVFNIVRATTFTLANTGTTTVLNLTVGTVTGAGVGAAALATSITLPFGLLSPIESGQFIQFVDTAGTEYLAELSSTAALNSVTLSVVALDEAIPVNAVALYPPEFTDRQNFDLKDDFTSAGFATFNTGGHEDAAIVGSSVDLSLDGLYFPFCPVYRTLTNFSAAGREFYFRAEDESARAGYTGEVVEMVAAITSREKPLSVDGFVSAKFSAKVVQLPTRIFAIPV